MTVEPLAFAMTFPVDSFPQGNERINEFNGLLIRLQGELVQIGKPVDNFTTIIFRHLGKNYRAVCNASRLHEKLSSLAEGQPIELTGILNINASETSNPQALIFPSDWLLLLRDENDIRPLPGGPWLTPRRRIVLQSFGGATLVVLVALTFYLRRKILNTHLIMAERKRMAADLHDTLEQSMAATAMQLKAANDSLPPSGDDARSFLHLASQILATAKTDLRSSVWNLRSDSLKTKTLEESIRDLVHSIRGIRVDCDVTRLPSNIPDYHAIHIFSIIQEAVANAIKHSGATELRILADSDSLVISDNGRGFDPAVVLPGHFGLAGMHERATRFNGAVVVDSSPNRGTKIVIHLFTFNTQAST